MINSYPILCSKRTLSVYMCRCIFVGTPATNHRQQKGYEVLSTSCFGRADQEEDHQKACFSIEYTTICIRIFLIRVVYRVLQNLSNFY